MKSSWQQTLIFEIIHVVVCFQFIILSLQIMMNTVSTVILLLFIVQHGSIINCTNLDYINDHEHHSIHKRSIDNDFGILPDVYYQNVAPIRNGQPVQVKVSVIILNLKIGSISTQVKCLIEIEIQTVQESIFIEIIKQGF